MTGKVNCTGTLPVGVLFDGKLHRDVVMRLATVGDEIDALDEGISDNGAPLAVIACCLEKLGDIPAEDITYELLHGGLVSEDYSYLVQLKAEVKKKLKSTYSDTANTSTPSSGSGNTASAKSASGAPVL